MVCVLQRMLDVLKIDAERAEWPFLRNLVDVEPTQADHIKQLLLEIHTPRVKPHQVTKTDLIEMIYYANRLAKLGFVAVRSRQHNWCCGTFADLMPKSVPEKCCYETFYVNTHFLDSARI